ncbi:MAG TPA: class I SAM-dependent methyltransferase [Gemmatimonadaceae bacterium]|jgi:SAM-dependent methyltransferase|nr:class I SAM-dependent methyltransferase [Gemmatimonadaceae bacterium]
MDAELFARFGEVESRHWWFAARREIVLGIIRRLAPDGACLLDVGCGTGYFLERARDHYSTAGVDPSPIAMAMCAGRKLTGVRSGSATDLSSFGDERFDIVTLLDVIEHVDDDVCAIRSAASVLRPGGRVVVTVPAFQFLWTAHDDINHHRRRYTRHRLGAVLGAGGFRVEQLSYFNCYLFPLALVERLGKRILRLDGGADLSLPPARVNALLQRIFRSEQNRLRRGGTFPVGLSVIGVGRLPDEGA